MHRYLIDPDGLLSIPGADRLLQNATAALQSHLFLANTHQRTQRDMAAQFRFAEWKP